MSSTAPSERTDVPACCSADDVPRQPVACREDLRVAQGVERAVGPAPLRLSRPQSRLCRTPGAELVGREVEDLRIVSCHLGAGASLTAVVGGQSVDTTMGFTPVEGLVMATRSGSVDPGLVLWLLEHTGLDAAALSDALEHDSGLKGLSGTSGDLRDVLEASGVGDEDARLAFAVFVHRLRRDIGAMTASSGGLDLLVFTGGIGEHAPTVRTQVVEGLSYLGAVLDEEVNQVTTTDRDISATEAQTRTVVVTSSEATEIARETRRLLTA